MVVEQEHLDTIFESVAVNLKLDKWRCVRKDFDKNIINFAGNFIYATIIDENTGKKTDVIVKRAPCIENFEEIVGYLYDTEIYVYKYLLPMFKSLNTKEVQDLFPESYYADNRAMVLKDMTLLGFERYTGGGYFDSEHIKLALNSISRFHALSFISFERKIKLPNQEVLRSYYDGHPYKYEHIIEFAVGKYQYLFKNTCHEAYIMNLHTNVAKNLRESVLKVKSKIYGHGDFWKENILFRYNRGKPTAVCLVDYQLTHLISPAQDVIFLLMNGIDSETRKKHCKQFLSTYYSNLRHVLSNNGVDPDSVYSEEDFHHDLRTVFPFAVSLSIFSFVLWLGLENVGSIMSEEDINLPKEEREPLVKKLKTIIQDIIFDFTQLGFVDE